MNSAGSQRSASDSELQYCLSYETMVRLQDAELDATSDYLKYCLGRIQLLGRPASQTDDGSSSTNNVESDLGTLSYLQMRRCLLRLGFTWKRSLSSQQPPPYDDDGISISAWTATSSWSGASGLQKSKSGRPVRREMIASDSQLIMLLCYLVEREERHRAQYWQRKSQTLEQQHKQQELNSDCQGLHLIELIQSYKMIIGGVQTLQTLSKSDLDAETLHQVSHRVRERTKRFLHPFFITNKSLVTIENSSVQEKDQTPYSCSSTPSIKLEVSVSKRDIAAISSPDGLAQPRLSEEKLKRLMHSKDSTLAKIIEEHEVERSVLTSNIQELQTKEKKKQKDLLNWKRRVQSVFFMIASGVLVGGLYLEYHRNKWLKREITLGQEIERREDAMAIAKLKEVKLSMEKKLADLKGKARYQENRMHAIQLSSNNTNNQIKDIEMKWWIDQAEIRRCDTSLKEMTVDLIQLKQKNHEVEEEMEWCQNSVYNRNIGLNLLQYDSKATSSVSLSNNNYAFEDGGFTVDNLQSEAQVSIKGNKPVKMEMKYNKSIRNAILLRQVYYGVGGAAASALLQSAVPGIFPFFAAKNVAPIAASMPKSSLSVNVAWVDRIHAFTVALLVVRTAVLFLMP